MVNKNKYLSGPSVSDEERRRQERNAFFILMGAFAFVVGMTFLLWWVRKSFL